MSTKQYLLILFKSYFIVFVRPHRMHKKCQKIMNTNRWCPLPIIPSKNFFKMNKASIDKFTTQFIEEITGDSI